MNLRSCVDELQKLGAVTDAQAQAALDRLDTLERNQPSMGQLAGYGALGAGAGVLSKGLGSVIERGALHNLTPRGLLAAGVTGGLMAGATPSVRQGIDRHLEMRKLKEYLQQPPAALTPGGVDIPEVPPKQEI